MKLFKSSILAIFALALGASFTSCSDDHNIVEGGETGAYFISNDEAIKLPEDGSDIVLTVARHSVTDPKSIAVTFDDPSGIFSGASSVEFEGDALTTTYVVSYDNAAIEEDVYYQVNITLDAAQASHYGVYNYTPLFVRLSPWTSLGMATYTEDILGSIFTFGPTEYQVEIQENDKTPGLYRLVNAYGAAFPYNEPGDWDDSKDYYIIIDATNPDAVNIGWTETGLDWGDGEFVFESRAQYFMDNGNSWEAVYNAGWFGTMKDGVITFPTKGFISGMQTTYPFPYFYGNSSGTWRVVMPGVVIADYSAELTYAGRLTSADDLNYIITDVQLGEDVESVRIAASLVPDVEAIASAIINDEIEYVELTESGEVRLPVSESGTYNVVAVIYAGGEPQNISSLPVKVELGGNDWEDAGIAYIADGWLLALGGYNPMDYIWMVPYQTSPSNPGLVKLVSLYGSETPVGNYALTGKYDILVDISNPQFVTVEPQCTGNEFFEDGVAWITEIGCYYTQLISEEKRLSPEDVIAVGVNSFYEDGIIQITIPFTGFGTATQIEKGWYTSAEELADCTPTLIQLVEGEVAMSKGLKSAKSLKASKASNLSHPATWSSFGRVMKQRAQQISPNL